MNECNFNLQIAKALEGYLKNSNLEVEFKYNTEQDLIGSKSLFLKPMALHSFIHFIDIDT